MEKEFIEGKISISKVLGIYQPITFSLREKKRAMKLSSSTEAKLTIALI
jgi:hypothetical protein